MASRTERALLASVSRSALAVASGLARGGPVRETADEGTPEATRVAAVVHAGVVLAVAGLATAVALLFFVLPPLLYVAVFAVLTAVLGSAGVRALRRLRVVAARGYLFWAGIAWGLLMASAAYLTQLTGFVPHIWLGWTLGMLVLGLFGAGAVQTAVAGLLAALWVGAAALVGESLLPALVILIALLAFPLLARPSRLVGAAVAVLVLALAVAYALRLLRQTPAVPLAVVTVVAACALLRVLVSRLPLDVLTGAPPHGCPGYGITSVINLLGIAAVVVVPLPPVLGMLREQLADAGSAGRAGLLLPVGVLVVAAALPGRLRPGSWPALVRWLAGAVALAAALLLAEPAPALAIAAMALVLAYFGARSSWRAVHATERPGRIWLAVGWLALAALLLALGRPWYVGAALLVLLGGYVVLLGVRWRGTDGPGYPVSFGIELPPPGEPAVQLPEQPEQPTPPAGPDTDPDRPAEALTARVPGPGATR